MIERELTFESGGVELAGTLTLPGEAGLYPAVVMVHGSGPLDRNENLKGQRLDIFNVFAEALAERGIASLRYDKRGCGQSGGDFNRTGHADLVDDAAAAWARLGDEPLVDDTRCYLLGHSEGTVIVPQVANRCGGSPERVAGLILVCPFVERMESVLMRQARQMVAEVDADRSVKGWLRKLLLRAVGLSVDGQAQLIRKVMATGRDVIRIRGRKFPALWLRELLALDIEALFANCSTPVLSICGAKDVQCLPGDGARIAELSAAPVDNIVVDNLSHVLRYESGEPGLLNTPKLLKKPMEREVVDLVLDWLNKPD